MEEQKSKAKELFSAKRIAKIAIFAALAYAISWVEIPIIPAVPFLKLDFGNVFILLSSFLFGPVEGILVCAVKEALRAITSSTGGVGEIANFTVTTAFILIPSVVYRFKKGIPVVLATMGAACFVQIGAALLMNRYVNFPLFGTLFGFDGIALFNASIWWIVLFNAVKSVSVCILTFLLYKRLEKLLNKF
ncbi:MAG: ECF transporter S component [Clostridia bacterium]|nr:ECF transporter S component [Clostridia bacterium]